MLSQGALTQKRSELAQRQQPFQRQVFHLPGNLALERLCRAGCSGVQDCHANFLSFDPRIDKLLQELHSAGRAPPRAAGLMDIGQRGFNGADRRPPGAERPQEASRVYAHAYGRSDRFDKRDQDVIGRAVRLGRLFQQRDILVPS